MSLQRRRGQTVEVWKTHETTDNRGNVVKAVDLVSPPHVVTAAVIPQRSAKAEVPGQQQINVVRLLVDPHLDDVDLWSRVRYAGKEWDIVTPPALHYGTRHTRHWSVDVRERP